MTSIIKLCSECLRMVESECKEHPGSRVESFKVSDKPRCLECGNVGTPNCSDHPTALIGYPPPEANPHCKCYPNMLAAHLCMEGHMTECHAGMSCSQARCSHLERYL
jgi:hypothetical protein